MFQAVFLVSGFCFLISPLRAAPVLSGYASDNGSIFWAWTSATTGTSFTLLTSTGGVIGVFGGGTSGSTTEAGLPAGTAIQREIAEFDGVTTTTSPLVTVGTPDASVVVPFGSPATLVGSDGLTRAASPAGSLTGQGQMSISADPVNKPLLSGTPARIVFANTAPPAGRTPVPASFREFTALANGSLFAGPFGAPATIQLPYSNTGVPVQTLALFTIDPVQGHWTQVPGFALDTTNKVVTAAVTHFSVYALFGVAGPDDLASLKAFPNPWRPGSGGPFDDTAGIHFRGLTPTATIKIFTITGEIVRRIDKQISDGEEVVWDGRNSDGDKVVSGVYFYLVTDPSTGRQVKDRIGIIR